ncbi:MAG TPA: YSC84-related protein [Pyrinomonadaceae bacterium]|nr:YSC84-related protein [Pyrinomonadaceae bacterium]
MELAKYFMIIILAFIFSISSASAIYAQANPTPTPDQKVEKKQKEIRKMAGDTLKRLYKAQPLAKAAVEQAAGYAVFSNTGVKILVSGSGKGHGVAVSNKNKKETFMQMFELQAGLGFGVKKFKLVFIFDTEEALNSFVDSGWQFGGQSDAAAKTGEDKGASAAGAVTVSKGVSLYQLTDKGLAIEITVKGSKYYKYDDLNK